MSIIPMNNERTLYVCILKWGSDAVLATHDRPSWRSLVRDFTCPATQLSKNVNVIIDLIVIICKNTCTTPQ